ncbi:MAG: beta-hydroxyacyl-ACP dehydratase [Thermoguttaceae bacterium]|nr:beta-hydroxyacyl-ACP dehydratase [Thermoguttaceae bacterium]
MRWFWMDRYTVFECGKRAQAIKAITRSEEHLSDHFPGYPVMPVALVIEGMAQAAGVLIHQYYNFTKKIVLGKVPRLAFTDVDLVPGDILVYDIDVDYIRDEGSMVSVKVQRDGKQIAEGAIVFAHLGEEYADQALYGAGDLDNLVRAFGVFDVGVSADGKPLVDPSLTRE